MEQLRISFSVFFRRLGARFDSISPLILLYSAELVARASENDLGGLGSDFGRYS